MSLLAGRKLLVADDSVTVQKVVDLTFTDEGCAVTAVGSGRQALEEIERDTPDVVLADATMPEPNGYQVCAYIKGDARLRHVPVVLLVGAFESFNEAEARKSGADDVLTKPFQSIREMVNKVGNLLGGKRETDEGATPAAEANTIFSLKDARRQTPLATQTAPPEGSTAATEFPFTVDEESVAQPPVNASVVSEAVSSSPDLRSDEALAFNYDAEPSLPRMEATTNLDSFDDDDRNIEVTPLDEQSHDSGESNASDDGIGEDFVEASGSNMAGYDVTSEPEYISRPDAMTASMNTETMTSNDLMRNMPGVAPESATTADDILLDLDGAPAPLPPADSAAFAAEDGLLDLDSPPPAPGSISPESPDSFDDIFAPAPEATDTAAQESVAMPLGSASFFDAAPGAQAETISLDEPRRDGGQLTLDQIAPEVIEAIARRVVEQLSEREVREIAWEVVPALAERMIKQRLETDEQGL